TRDFVHEIATTYRFTFQDLRRVAETARDLEMWREESLESWWQRAETEVSGHGRQRKKALLGRLDTHRNTLRAVETRYPEGGLAPPSRRSVRLQEAESSGDVFGRCPAYSDNTVCCSLRTIDAVRGCPFGCSYCTIQTFYGETAELETNLAQKLDAVELDPLHLYHVGTGQASDSLVWGNRGGVLEVLLGFARKHPNVVLELKTKSDNVDPLLTDDAGDRKIPSTVVCSWSLAPDSVIENEEHGTASLARRLAAARKVADRGVGVGFHFHPMVAHQGWRDAYADIAAKLQAQFDPREVAFISMGAPTFIRPVVQEIRRRGGETKILQSELVADHHGKLTYPDEIKVELYGHLFAAFSPWHDEVFFYLCMETETMWQKTLGWSHATNSAFERAFALHCLRRDDCESARVADSAS
ncbi:MAG: DNA photolyase, partial [Acidobacteriota bacterium]|nr:DNA photolyase [Acidobacteriota bacterium]